MVIKKYYKGENVGLIDELRNLTKVSREKIETQKNAELEREKLRQKWIIEQRVPELASKYYRDILELLKDQAKGGEDALIFAIEHFGKPSRLDEEIFPAFRSLRKKLISDGFEVSEIESKTEKIHDTSGNEDHKISCSIMIQW